MGYGFRAVVSQIYELVGDCRIFKIPQVDAVIIGGKKLFTVTANTQRVYIVLMAIFELFPLDSFDS